MIEKNPDLASSLQDSMSAPLIAQEISGNESERESRKNGNSCQRF